MIGVKAATAEPLRARSETGVKREGVSQAEFRAKSEAIVAGRDGLKTDFSL